MTKGHVQMHCLQDILWIDIPFLEDGHGTRYRSLRASISASRFVKLHSRLSRKSPCVIYSVILEFSKRIYFKEFCIFVRCKSVVRLSRKRPQRYRLEGLRAKSTKGLFQSNSKSEFFTNVDVFYWSLTMSVSVTLIYGQDGTPIAHVFPKQSMVLEIKNSADVNPCADAIPVKHFDVPVSKLLEHCDYFRGEPVRFKINRTDEKCFTPRRNQEVDDLIDALGLFSTWALEVKEYLERRFFSLKACNDPFTLVAFMQAQKVLVPVVPLVPGQDISANLMSEHVSSIQRVESMFLDNVKSAPIALVGALVVLLGHCHEICQAFLDGVNYIEDLLYKQLVQGIGKHVSAKDLGEYMVFHNRNIFKPEFQPQSFSCDVRRTGYTPEGTVAIEIVGESNTQITTTCKRIDQPKPVRVALNASTTVRLDGPHFIHGFMSHQFSTEATPSYQVSARARQFSSFILLIGTIVENDLFDCKHGIIVQNKDELLIPLLLETLASAGEFRDAIASLSPEQQRFAKAFRQMQLQSTMFSMCIVQIKPQLEAVLQLEAGALTKEIKLTQDLMKLFIEHQIPSDMLNFEGAKDTVQLDKINVVKAATKAILDMIEAAKQEEVDERKRASGVVKAENDASARFYKQTNKSGKRSLTLDVVKKREITTQNPLIIPQPAQVTLQLVQAILLCLGATSQHLLITAQATPGLVQAILLCLLVMLRHPLMTLETLLLRLRAIPQHPQLRSKCQ